MVKEDITQTTNTELDTKVDDYSVDSVTLDAAQDQKENVYDNAEFKEYFGYYKKIPEYKTAINAYATWVIGKGWTADTRTTAILESLDGWGEDTFMSIIWNMLIVKKVQGDAFAEIVRDNEDGRLMNIKPLGTLRIVTNRKGRIKRYEERTKVGERTTIKKFEPNRILHLVNDRVGDEIHGTSITESVKWVIDARNEAMADVRRTLHRSTVRLLYIDEDDKARLANLKRDYAEAINKGELLILPIKRGEGEFVDLAPPQTQQLEWIRYLENFYYQALGVPKVIMGGSEEFTEASSKIAYLTYEQVYMREFEELKADLWEQVQIRIEMVKPASLENEMLQSGEKSKEQVGFQPNDTIAGVGK